ncbi:hypothetical protein [Micromonospora sp. WMMD710]|uniref:hypothetical protein n=1 Tax=Micromonospora sp. WMMD710 TaxID=3016085 RepID=UPI002417E6E7|nr:hypothetical protein [Micromonospora sp. WMMD710]MDG4760503.1 hypothetical protein [Micromonospora sp. WMMD710]
MAALPLAALAVTASVAAFPAPAAAHPFGDPQTVEVTADDQRPEAVHVRWRVGGPDDLTVLGVSLGLLPHDRILLDGAVDYRITDPAVIASSKQFPTYLLQRITVADGAQPCAGTVAPPKALARVGASIDYTCPGPVERVTVAVRMLTDLNPAYRAMATGPGGQRAVYGSGEDTHDWTLVGAPAAGSTHLGRSAAVQITALAGGALLVTGAALVAARRLRRRKAGA